MSEVAEVDALLAKALKEQRNRLETLGIMSAIALVAVASWYIWPGIEGRTDFLSRFGPGIVLVVLALAMQDLIDFGPKHRSRIGALAAVAWAPLLMLGMAAFITSDEMTVRLGNALLAVIGIVCYSLTSGILTGSLQAVRFRGLVQLLGATSATALLLSNPLEGMVLLASTTICLLAFAVAIYDTIGKDPDKAARRKFKQLREKLEMRILELRAEGIQVDQAASLLQNASETGYVDPKEGMTLLNLALDEIERTLAMSSDISDIRADAANAVEKADDIAPTAKRAKRILIQGDREMELGSLREAEMLFRKAKKHASEIIEFWNQAETAIADAKRALSGQDGVQFEPLKRSVEGAEEALLREAPAEAIGLVITVPEHVENLADAGDVAAETVSEAKRAVEAASGIDEVDFALRLEKADKAYENGDYSLARGLADSVHREVTREAEAMVEVQKAWRQRKKLIARWTDWANSDEWNERLKAVDKARKKKQWSHAAMLLEQMTNELDSEGAASTEAGELLAFLQEEWRGLRDKLEAAGIKVRDAERNGCEAVVGEAAAAHQKGDIDTCLTKLGEADGRMEKLRRRI
ncbi:MAG TPA: hypothetical protein HA340_02765 [Candidatus Thalassarchaeaceae archaeon]|jgi:hypothetical protein|nr:hypothetical protein [Candidatus Thalassarchaeaceae archaeon]DAC50901.1 MAG TPA: hypothetical protein D7H97_02720 [Candidatus Poseidoniales archaeon]HIH82847.1 hypothetical protein [Candidatus Thalassarchaeaceae archaeon]